MSSLSASDDDLTLPPPSSPFVASPPPPLSHEEYADDDDERRVDLEDEEDDELLGGVESRRPLKQRLLDREYRVHVHTWLSQAWPLFVKHWPFFVTWALVLEIIGICSYFFFPLVVVTWPLTGSLILAVCGQLRTSAPSSPSLRDFLGGFINIVPVLIVCGITFVAVFAGFFLLIIPALYLLPALSFALPIALEFKDMGIGPIDALRISEQVVRRNFFRVALFYYLCALITLIGALTVVPYLVLAPLTSIAYVIAFKDIFGLRDHHQYGLLHHLP